MRDWPSHRADSALDRPGTAFDGLLAEGAAVTELRGPDFRSSDLLPEENRFVARAVEKRRREFAAGRSCARLALRRLGAAPAAIGAIGVGSFREPLFPAGFSGSITHTAEYCAAAVARTRSVLSIGIDAEFNRPLDRSVADLVLIPTELQEIGAVTAGCHAETLVFSIKEAFFKAVFPFLGQYLEFSDVTVALSGADRTFQASLNEAGLMARLPIARIIGRYRFDERHLYTAVSLLSRDASDADAR